MTSIGDTIVVSMGAWADLVRTISALQCLQSPSIHHLRGQVDFGRASNLCAATSRFQ